MQRARKRVQFAIPKDLDDLDKLSTENPKNVILKIAEFSNFSA